MDKFKKNLLTLLSISMFSSCLASCSSVGEPERPSGVDISINGFTKNDDKYSTKVDNNITTYSFIDKVTTDKNSSWKLYSDINGSNEIVTKTIDLEVGDNTNYILVTASDGKLGLYTVNVRRLDVFTVSFNTKGGTSIESQQIQEESLVQPVSNPTRSGYDFDKWDYDFNVPVLSDLVINALWVSHNITITFDSNGGQLDSNTLEVKYNDNVTLPTPVKTGYLFSGWYYNEEKITNGYWKIDKNITLTAKWTANTYYISFNTDGGNQINRLRVTFDSSFTLPTPVKAGHTFASWNYNGNTFQSGIYAIASDITIIAVWDVNSYTIQFNSNGGSKIDSITKNYGSTVEAPTAPTKKGYTFKGWDQTFPLTFTDNLTVNAIWEANKYQINFDKNKKVTVTFDLNYDDKKEVKEYENGELLEFKEDPIRSGYYFAGWFTDSECTKKNKFSFASTLTDDITLYAKWNTVVNPTSNTRLSFLTTTSNTYYINIDEYNSGEQDFYCDKTGRYQMRCGTLTSVLQIDITGVYTSNPMRKNNIMYDQNLTNHTVYFDAEAGDTITVAIRKTILQSGFTGATKIDYSIYNNVVTPTPKSPIVYSLPPMDVEFDSHYSIPTIEKAGKTFVGWYDKDGNKFDNTGIYQIDSSIDLFSKFE